MKNLLIAIMLLACCDVSAQWPKVYGQYSYDMIGRGLSNSYDNGLIFCGAERKSVNGKLEGYLIKTDINGVQLWRRGIEYKDSNNEVIILGCSQQPTGGILLSGIYLMEDLSQADGFFMKLNSCGEKEWCKTVPVSGYSYCRDNIVLPDGSMIIHGEEQGSVYHRIWLYKINTSGDFLWKKEMDLTDDYFNATAYVMKAIGDSSIILTGFSQSIRDTANPNWGWDTPFWIKFDFDGNQVWDLPWFTSTHIIGQANSTIQSLTGELYSVGDQGLGSEREGCLFQISENGNSLSEYFFEGFGEASGLYTLNFFSDSTLFIGGAYYVQGTGYSMVIKSDTSGTFINTIDVPLGGYPLCYSAATSVNKVFAMGDRLNTTSIYHEEVCLFKFNSELEYDSLYTAPRTYDSLCPYPVIPQLDFVLDCPMVSVPEPEEIKEKNTLKIYPNPANDWVTIEFPEYFLEESQTGWLKMSTTYKTLPGLKRLDVINLQGQLVHSEEFDDDRTSLTLNCSTWPSGMYLIRLSSNGKIRVQGKLIRR